MARPKADRSGTEYDKAALRRQPVLFPPPRDPVNRMDTGLLPRYGLGRDSGFLPKFQTAEAMEEAIETYFKYVEEHERPPTMAGLALALGFKSVTTLKNYEKRGEDYAYIIEVARTRIEDWKNTLLLRAEKTVNGIIFDLKNNHGWADKIEQTTVHQAGNSLAELLTALQGNVLRPAAIEQPDPAAQAIEAEFEEVPLNPLHRELGAMDEAYESYEAEKADPQFPEIPDDLKDLL